jgi:DNA repair photolyase
MIKEIRAKTLVSRVTGIDTYFGLDYGMNLYRGCQHRCIYCDSRSNCYGIDHFDRDVLIKVNAIDLLRDELPRKRRKGILGTGSMNDPYMPLEEKAKLTQRALEVIAEHGFGVHVLTKSDLVLRDVPILKRIARVAAAVSFTITTIDDALARKVEPLSPPSSARFRALEALAEEGIETRIALLPVLPFLEDDWDNVSAIVDRARECGVKAVIAWFGMSLRDRQRTYFYGRLDELFPGLRAKYEAAYGNDYACPSPNAKELAERFAELCASYGIATSVRPQLAPTAEQLKLL